VKTFAEALEAVRVISHGPPERLYKDLVRELNNSAELREWIEALEEWVETGKVSQYGCLKLTFLRGIMVGMEMRSVPANAEPTATTGGEAKA
jgi:hypothetical protein